MAAFTNSADQHSTTGSRLHSSMKTRNIQLDVRKTPLPRCVVFAPAKSLDKCREGSFSFSMLFRKCYTTRLHLEGGRLPVLVKPPLMWPKLDASAYLLPRIGVTTCPYPCEPSVRSKYTTYFTRIPVAPCARRRPYPPAACGGLPRQPKVRLPRLPSIWISCDAYNTQHVKFVRVTAGKKKRVPSTLLILMMPSPNCTTCE